MTMPPSSVVRVLGLVVLVSAIAGPAAGLTRTWVAPGGDDANTCDRSAPCRTFATALGKTDAGGEIDAVGAGDYGPVVITKAVTIDGGAGLAGITQTTPLGSAVKVNAGASDVVTLRNLSMTGGGVALYGLFANGGRSVVIERCSISGFLDGIHINATAAPMTVTVTDTTIQNNSGFGVFVDSDFYYVRLTATRVRLLDNATGMNILTSALVYVTDSIVANNTSNGFRVLGGTTPYFLPAQLSLEGTSISHNGGSGVVSQNSTAVVRISDSTVDHNYAVGLLSLSGGQILSYGNNRVSANGGGDGAPTGSVIPM